MFVCSFPRLINRRFYKEFPHPDETQRKELSRQLGIAPIQVKFWFQNKRTQMKVRTIRVSVSYLNV